jgi:hypothetical protein
VPTAVDILILLDQEDLEKAVSDERFDRLELIGLKDNSYSL